MIVKLLMSCWSNEKGSLMLYLGSGVYTSTALQDTARYFYLGADGEIVGSCVSPSDNRYGLWEELQE